MKKLQGIFLLLVSLMVFPAVAEDQLSVHIESQKEIVEVNEQGEQVIRYVSVDAALPGDTILYTISVENNGQLSADNVTVNDPVPESTRYIEGSTFSSLMGEGDVRTTFSADGGNVYLPRGSLTIVDQSGIERDAVATDITHIRWQLNNSIPGGKKVKVGYRAVVN